MNFSFIGLVFDVEMEIDGGFINLMKFPQRLEIYFERRWSN